MHIKRVVVGLVEGFVCSCTEIKGEIKEVNHLEIASNCDAYSCGLQNAGHFLGLGHGLPRRAPDGHGTVVPVEGGLTIGEVGEEGEDVETNQFTDFGPIIRSHGPIKRVSCLL